MSTEDVDFHGISLTNFIADTTYFFRVSSTDISDNGPTTFDSTFTTAASADDIPPVIFDILVLSKTNATATIVFLTDELGDTFIEFDTESDSVEFGQPTVVGEATDVIDHVVTLTNLTDSTEYFFAVGSIDKSGNENTPSASKRSGTFSSKAILSFTTNSSADLTAPATPSSASGEAGNGEIVVTWDANSEGDLGGYSLFRKTAAAPDTTLIASAVTDTFYFDNGLTNGTTYEYFVTASDNQNPPNESSKTAAVSLTPNVGLSPAAPALSFPAEGQNVRNDAINLVVDNAALPASRTALTYEFVIAEESDFFNQVALADNIVEGDLQTIWSSGLTLIDQQTYFWKSRTFDGFFFSDWSSPQSFVADASVPTSVKLLDFWGDIDNSKFVLNWTTALEIDNAGFAIYRSLDENKGYVKIVDLQSIGEGFYSFEDAGI